LIFGHSPTFYMHGLSIERKPLEKVAESVFVIQCLDHTGLDLWEYMCHFPVTWRSPATAMDTTILELIWQGETHFQYNQQQRPLEFHKLWQYLHHWLPQKLFNTIAIGRYCRFIMGSESNNAERVALVSREHEEWIRALEAGINILSRMKVWRTMLLYAQSGPVPVAEMTAPAKHVQRVCDHPTHMIAP